MNNLLYDLGLARGASQREVDAALDAADPSMTSLSESRAVLSDPLRRTHYERLHAQYEAIAATVDLLQLAGTVDTHRWAERVVEFDEP